MQRQMKKMDQFAIATKSRSRTYLRKVKTMKEEPKKRLNLRRLGTMNEFLEDRTAWQSPDSHQSSQQRNNIRRILRRKQPCREMNLLRQVKDTERSVVSSQFSRMQTGIEDTDESIQKEQSVMQSIDEQSSSSETGHFKFIIGEILKKKYQVVKHICDGTFGRVLEVEDIKDRNKKHYALKVIRPVKRYIEAAKEEADILKKLPEDKHIIPLIDTFYHKHHYCIMTPLYGPSLAQFQQTNNYQGYPISSIQSIGKQLIKTLKLIHNLNLTHTDLKPENILLSSKKETIYGKYKVPDSDKIVLIDFGNATFANEHHSRVINTREYRAPEVLLQCCKWSEVSDMWAVGCILCELYNGECLFAGMHADGEDDLGLVEHLKRIQKLAGNIPEWMAYQSSEHIQQMAIKRKLRDSKNIVQLQMHELQKDKKVIKNINKMLVIKDIIDPSYPELIDLLQKLFVIDPIKRISAKDALKHPFFSVQYQ